MLGCFYGDIMGLEGASKLRSDQPAGGASSKEMNSTRTCWRSRRQPLLRQQPEKMVPAQPPTPPACEGAEAGTGDPAPCKGAVPRQLNSKPGRCRGEKKSFHELIEITVRDLSIQ